MLHLDIKTAFLNGVNLYEELDVAQPTRFVMKGHERLVCKPNGCLDGLKQASRALNLKFHRFLTKFGFVRRNADSCEYVKNKDYCLIIIPI